LTSHLVVYKGIFQKGLAVGPPEHSESHQHVVIFAAGIKHLFDTTNRRQGSLHESL
jgi:hypothetical protein